MLSNTSSKKSAGRSDPDFSFGTIFLFLSLLFSAIGLLPWLHFLDSKVLFSTPFHRFVMINLSLFFFLIPIFLELRLKPKTIGFKDSGDQKSKLINLFLTGILSLSFVALSALWNRNHLLPHLCAAASGFLFLLLLVIKRHSISEKRLYLGYFMASIFLFSNTILGFDIFLPGFFSSTFFDFAYRLLFRFIPVLFILFMSLSYLSKTKLSSKASLFFPLLAVLLLAPSLLSSAVNTVHYLHFIYVFGLGALFLLSLRSLFGISRQTKERDRKSFSKTELSLWFLLLLTAVTRMTAHMSENIYISHLSYAALLWIATLLLWAFIQFQSRICKISNSATKKGKYKCQNQDQKL